MTLLYCKIGRIDEFPRVWWCHGTLGKPAGFCVGKQSFPGLDIAAGTILALKTGEQLFGVKTVGFGFGALIGPGIVIFLVGRWWGFIGREIET